MGGSRLEGNDRLEVGRYKMVFLDYLQKAEDLCQCEELLTRCEHLCDMRKAYGIKLVTVEEYREEFLSLCGMLRAKHGLNGNFDEAFGRVEMDYEIRKEEEEIAYRRLKEAIQETFGNEEKVVQMYGGPRRVVNLRAMLTKDDDAAMRRGYFRQLLMREGDPVSPAMMTTCFQDKISLLYDSALKTTD